MIWPHKPAMKGRKPRSNAPTTALMAIALTAGSPAVQAADGCVVLLCLAAPNWSAIPQCVGPIRQVLRDLLIGKPFPTCAMSGSGNTANNRWAEAPALCPPQYTQSIEGESTTSQYCDFTGVISLSVNGQPFSRTWWSVSGDAVTEFLPAARQTLTRWNTRFDDDLAAWRARQPSSP